MIICDTSRANVKPVVSKSIWCTGDMVSTNTIFYQINTGSFVDKIFVTVDAITTFWTAIFCSFYQLDAAVLIRRPVHEADLNNLPIRNPPPTCHRVTNNRWPSDAD